MTTDTTTTHSSESPLADQTVGEIVAGNPNLSRVFQSFDIGFCCQGKLTLGKACERKGIELEEMIDALEAERKRTPESQINAAEMTLSELTNYIVETHHGFLRSELPRIHAMAERVAQVHGEHTPSLVEVYQVFTEMGQTMAEHARREESTLFPSLAEPASEAAGDQRSQLIDEMVEEHESIIGAISKLRELTNGYQPPAEACNTYRALFAGLADLEADTGQHFHLENNVLFPAALQRAS
jgi:regulator of cell morphogenesis and NO signaling